MFKILINKRIIIVCTIRYHIISFIILYYDKFVLPPAGCIEARPLRTVGALSKIDDLLRRDEVLAGADARVLFKKISLFQTI